MSDRESINNTNVHSARDTVPVILDTDLGVDIDDTWALAMLLGMPHVDLRLVVTAFDNTPAKTRLVAKILQDAGRTDIPIGTGIQTNDNATNQERWLGEYDVGSYPGTIHADGVDALIGAVHDSPAGVILLAIGPATNIAEALRRDPEIARKARVVAMAGSVYEGHAQGDPPIAEFNVLCDVAAFRALITAPWDVTLSPLDGCARLVLRGDRYARVQASQAPRARVVMENYAAWTERRHYPVDCSSVLYDTVAAYLTTGTSLCDMRDVALSVDSQGMTIPDPGGKLVHCQVGWKDQGAMEELIVRSLTGEDRP
jgi:inosine-uridine nucleoside N-ribohydrolase